MLRLLWSVVGVGLVGGVGLAPGGYFGDFAAFLEASDGTGGFPPCRSLDLSSDKVRDELAGGRVRDG